MNLLCLEQFAGLGGGQLSLLSLLPAFRERGWRPILAIPRDGPLAERARRLGFEVTTMRCASYANGHKTPTDLVRFAAEFPRMISAIRRMISAHDIDLIYVNAPRLLPTAAVAARLRSIPVVFHCHNRLTQWAGLITAGEALRLSRAYVIACCKYAADPIQPYVHPERLSILYNGVGNLSSAAGGSPREVRHIGVIGRIEREKGQLEFVHAARGVFKRFPGCCFYIIGAPLFSNSEYFHKVVGLNRDLPIAFLGWRDDIAAVLAQLDLLVVSSNRLDSAPRVIFEAFSSRVPVVAFPSGGIPEIIMDGENGFLACTREPEALAERICSIITMPPSHIREVVDEAWLRWQQEYTVERYQQQVAQLIQHAIASYGA